jgi:short-subunit dehydrogenase
MHSSTGGSTSTGAQPETGRADPLAPGTAAMALVTGASSGIGLEIARQLAGRSHHLVLVARSADKLGKLAEDLAGRYGINAYVVTADLTDPLSPPRIGNWLRERGLTIDVLVNNAGFGVAGRFHTSPINRQLDILQVNAHALTHLTGVLLPDMIARRFGRILNVASTAGFQPLPRLAVYAATKSYVMSYSDALSAELAGTGVTVTCLCPGPTETAFASVAGMSGMRVFRYAATAEIVAREGLKAMFAGRRRHVVGSLNRLGTLAARLLPQRLVLKTGKLLLR